MTLQLTYRAMEQKIKQVGQEIKQVGQEIKQVGQEINNIKNQTTCKIEKGVSSIGLNKKYPTLEDPILKNILPKDNLYIEDLASKTNAAYKNQILKKIEEKNEKNQTILEIGMLQKIKSLIQERSSISHLISESIIGIKMFPNNEDFRKLLGYFVAFLEINRSYWNMELLDLLGDSFEENFHILFEIMPVINTRIFNDLSLSLDSLISLPKGNDNSSLNEVSNNTVLFHNMISELEVHLKTVLQPDSFGHNNMDLKKIESILKEVRNMADKLNISHSQINKKKPAEKLSTDGVDKQTLNTLTSVIEKFLKDLELLESFYKKENGVLNKINGVIESAKSPDKTDLIKKIQELEKFKNKCFESFVQECLTVFLDMKDPKNPNLKTLPNMYKINQNSKDLPLSTQKFLLLIKNDSVLHPIFHSDFFAKNKFEVSQEVLQNHKDDNNLSGLLKYNNMIADLKFEEKIIKILAKSLLDRNFSLDPKNILSEIGSITKEVNGIFKDQESFSKFINSIPQKDMKERLNPLFRNMLIRNPDFLKLINIMTFRFADNIKKIEERFNKGFLYAENTHLFFNTNDIPLIQSELKNSSILSELLKEDINKTDEKGNFIVAQSLLKQIQTLSLNTWNNKNRNIIDFQEKVIDIYVEHFTDLHINDFRKNRDYFTRLCIHFPNLSVAKDLSKFKAESILNKQLYTEDQVNYILIVVELLTHQNRESQFTDLIESKTNFCKKNGNKSLTSTFDSILKNDDLCPEEMIKGLSLMAGFQNDKNVQDFLGKLFESNYFKDPNFEFHSKNKNQCKSSTECDILNKSNIEHHKEDMHSSKILHKELHKTDSSEKDHTLNSKKNQ